MNDKFKKFMVFKSFSNFINNKKVLVSVLIIISLMFLMGQVSCSPMSLICTSDEEGGTQCDDGYVYECVFESGTYVWESTGSTCEYDTESDCTNSTDDDDDGYTDCADPDCDALTGPSGETCEYGAETTCTDTYDNDADGSADCDDTDCSTDSSCCTATETTEATCDDSVDNDCDGTTDCSDSDCSAVDVCLSAECTLDSECETLYGTGYICNTSGYCELSTTEDNTTNTTTEDCTNGVDDDNDSLVDCNDTTDCPCDSGYSCNTTSALCELDSTTTTENCTNSTDDDGDGDIDCADSDCNASTGSSGETCEYGTELTCNDGYDNDGDDLIDCFDDDCSSYTTCDLINAFANYEAVSTDPDNSILSCDAACAEEGLICVQTEAYKDTSSSYDAPGLLGSKNFNLNCSYEAEHGYTYRCKCVDLSSYSDLATTLSGHSLYATNSSCNYVCGANSKLCVHAEKARMNDSIYDYTGVTSSCSSSGSTKVTMVDLPLITGAAVVNDSDSPIPEAEKMDTTSHNYTKHCSCVDELSDYSEFLTLLNDYDYDLTDPSNADEDTCDEVCNDMDKFCIGVEAYTDSSNITFSFTGALGYRSRTCDYESSTINRCKCI